MELRDYLRVLWRRKLIIITTTIVTIVVVGVGTRYITPVYQASATLRIAVSAGGSLDYSDFIYADRLMNTYVEIATSRPVVEELTKRLGLTETPILNVEIIPDTELIIITVEDVNPERAALVANTLVDILIQQSSRLYIGGGKILTEVLGEQLAQAKAALEESRQEYEKLLRVTATPPERIDAASQLFQLTQNNYATLLGQYEQAHFREEIQAGMITVFEPAIIPRTPSSPRVALNIALGIMVGLLGGLGLAFILENLDTTLYTAEDIESVTKLTAFAKIPKANKDQISSFQDSFSPISEAFRNLATNIQQIDHRLPVKVLLVISAEPNQGKSLVVSRLAFALAECGKKVVAIDGDMRLPRLHTLFGLPNEYGLADVLERRVSLEKALQKSSYDGVKMLASGALPSHPTKLLGSPQMAKLIGSLSKKFDYVLIDTPALLGLADVAALIQKVDGFLWVVRRAHAKREAVAEARKFLEAFCEKSMGLIVNQADNYSYYVYYHHQRRSEVSTASSDKETISVPNVTDGVIDQQ